MYECQLRFHPEYPNQLLSGSTDGTVSLLDLYQSEEDEALLRTVSTGSVQQLHWVSRTDAVVLTHDEKISICPMDTSEAEGSITALVHELGDLREQLSSRYIIKAVHHCGRSLLGSGNAE